MVKKLDVGLIRRRFAASVRQLDDALGAADSLTESNRRFVAEACLLAVGVVWEGFVSEVFIAYVNHDSAVVRRRLLNQITQSVKSKHGSLVASNVSMTLPRHLTRSQVAHLLDADERHVSFGSANEMVARAKELLPAATAARFEGLTLYERQVIDVCKALRNFLAHRSEASRRALNEALRGSVLWPGLRRGRRPVRNVGAYFTDRFRKPHPIRARSLLNIMLHIGAKL